MALHACLMNLQQDLCAQEPPVKDSQRVLVNAVNQLSGMAHLVLAVLAKYGISEQVRCQWRQREHAQLRIAGDYARCVLPGAQVLKVTRGIRGSQSAAIYGAASQTTPALTSLMACVPSQGRQSKQLCQGLLTQSLTGLGDGTGGNVWIDLVGEHQIELGHNLCNRLESVHRQCNEQPDDLFGR